ncbi:MAG: hypothetical protein GXP55_09200 [Deltaproteobacteria bacterium]|nr:hypothetical protein [Deltaproteobacteria bacterium]
MIRVPVSVGELIDKITILEIKAERISDQGKLENVQREFEALHAIRAREIEDTDALRQTTAALRRVNEALWAIEDAIREQERRGDFGERFIELARSVYRQNDQRARLKREIAELTGSALIEEKSYAAY